MFFRTLVMTFAIIVSGTACAESDTVTIPTRFGSLTTNADALLLFKSKVINPELAVLSNAYVLSTYKLDGTDVVLISQAAGTACPGQYVFVTVSKDGAKATPTFGTCYDDEVKPTVIDQSIAFSMKKMGGKGSSRYIYERGVVFENGKPVK